MALPFRLGLRRNGHMVTLLKTGDGREMLGVAYPRTVDRRLRLLDHWGMREQSPRPAKLNTIDIPLALRTRTILSHELDPAVQSRLNGGQGPLGRSRRAEQAGVRERIHIGPGRPIRGAG